MVVDENIQSLQEGNLSIFLLGAVAEQRTSKIGEGRIPLSDCTNNLQAEHQAKLCGTQATPKGQWKRMA